MISALSLTLICFVSYAALFVGRLLGRWSGDELSYQNFRWSYVILFMLFAAALAASYQYFALLFLIICYLVFKTRYAFVLMEFILGLGLLFSKDIALSVELITLFHLMLGAIFFVQKKSVRFTFKQSTVFLVGLLVSVVGYFISYL